MQTPAEKCLVNQCVHLLKEKRCERATPRILNVGAGQSLSIEKQLCNAGVSYVCDRVDVESCTVDYPTVENCCQCSVNSMSLLEADTYAISYANFLLEHVQGLEKAAIEICRILEPGGYFITTVPNPTALEILLSEYTPLWFHKMIRRENAWKTYYEYEDIVHLRNIFERAGFHFVDASYYPFVEGYLYKFPIVGLLGKLYDKIISDLKIRKLMGHVCIVFEKP